MNSWRNIQSPLRFIKLICSKSMAGEVNFDFPSKI